MYNHVELIGNVGADPEIKQFDSHNLAKIRLATSRTFIRKNGEKETETQWHQIVVWGNTADFVAQYIHRGDQVHITGTIKYRSYDKDGATVWVTEIEALRINKLGKRDQNERSVDASSESSNSYM